MLSTRTYLPNSLKTLVIDISDNIYISLIIFLIWSPTAFACRSAGLTQTWWTSLPDTKKFARKLLRFV